MKTQFICLANSRRESGRCIAGVRTDKGGWFRPISATTGGPLMRRDYLFKDGNTPELLDTIEVEVTEHKPEVYQPENWILGSRTWKLTNKINPVNAFQVLKSSVIPQSDLFGNNTDRVLLSVLKTNPINASLALVKPTEISWVITNSVHGKRQNRTLFEFGGNTYNLVITDIEWEKRLSGLSDGVHPREACGLGKTETILFTISLGGPFGGACYKLVAGVIVLPR